MRKIFFSIPLNARNSLLKYGGISAAYTYYNTVSFSTLVENTGSVFSYKIHYFPELKAA